MWPTGFSKAIFTRFLNAIHFEFSIRGFRWHGAERGWHFWVHEEEKNRALIQNSFKATKQLCLAASNGHEEDIHELIMEGADVNEKDENGMTAIQHACQNKRVHIVELLLRCGANVNTENRVGQSCLTIAVLQRHFGLVKLLIEAGADVNGGEGKSKHLPLQYAIKYRLDHIAVILITNGAWLDDDQLATVAYDYHEVLKWKCLFSSSLISEY